MLRVVELPKGLRTIVVSGTGVKLLAALPSRIARTDLAARAGPLELWGLGSLVPQSKSIFGPCVLTWRPLQVRSTRRAHLAKVIAYQPMSKSLASMRISPQLTSHKVSPRPTSKPAKPSQLHSKNMAVETRGSRHGVPGTLHGAAEQCDD